MACRGFWECLLKLLNFMMTLVGLAMVGYGIYLFVMYKQTEVDPVFPPVSGDEAFIQLGRPLLMSVSLSNNIFDNLPKAWFIYLFIGVGALLFVISCCGCIGALTRNGCCLTTYAIFIILLISVEIGCAAFMFFNKNWDERLPKDKTGNFEKIFDFIDDNWGIAKWVLVGLVGLQALLFLLAVIVKAVNRTDYNSEDEFFNPFYSSRWSLIKQRSPATGVPVTGSEQRTTRSDAWSAHMNCNTIIPQLNMAAFGLTAAVFQHNPNELGQYQQIGAQQTEERGRCTIM